MDEIIFRKNFNHSISDSGEDTIRVGIEVTQEFIHKGLIKRLGYRDFSIFTVLVSYMNNDLISFPSLDHVAELTGMSRQTVIKGVKALETKGLIERTAGGRVNVYKLNYVALNNKQNEYELEVEQDPIEEPEEIEEIEEPEVEEEPIEFNSPKDVAFYFADKYEKQYGHKYMINYGRDLKLIKDKLIPTYSSEELALLIDTAITHYKEKWGNQKYSHPTIPMLASWLSNQALTFAKEQVAVKERLTHNIKDSEETDDTDIALDIF